MDLDPGVPDDLRHGVWNLLKPRAIGASAVEVMRGRIGQKRPTFGRSLQDRWLEPHREDLRREPNRFGRNVLPHATLPKGVSPEGLPVPVRGQPPVKFLPAFPEVGVKVRPGKLRGDVLAHPAGDRQEDVSRGPSPKERPDDGLKQAVNADLGFEVSPRLQGRGNRQDQVGPGRRLIHEARQGHDQGHLRQG